jgi:hypothetical protein
MISTNDSVDPGIDRGQAEALLSDVAATLLRLPFEGRTRPLHIRALQLRGRVGNWGPSDPPEDEQRAIRASILALRTEAASWQAVLR